MTTAIISHILVLMAKINILSDNSYKLESFYYLCHIKKEIFFIINLIK